MQGNNSERILEIETAAHLKGLLPRSWPQQPVSGAGATEQMDQAKIKGVSQ